MDTNAIEKPCPRKKPVLAWKCTTDGKFWKVSGEKKCEYCLPIYNKHELAMLKNKERKP